MALSGPVGMDPTTMPISRARGRVCAATELANRRNGSNRLAFTLRKLAPFDNRGSCAACRAGNTTRGGTGGQRVGVDGRSEEHTSELQSRLHLVCRLLLEKKKKTNRHETTR